MLNFSRRDRSAKRRTSTRARSNPHSTIRRAMRTGARRRRIRRRARRRSFPRRNPRSRSRPPFGVGSPGAPAAEQAPPHRAAKSRTPSAAGSHVGINVKLKGVEISDCDLLVVEGRVEATVRSKAMEIAKPGTLQGTVRSTSRRSTATSRARPPHAKRLVVHGTGRVAGTIRYGKLVVEEGRRALGRCEARGRRARDRRGRGSHARESSWRPMRLTDPRPGVGIALALIARNGLARRARAAPPGSAPCACGIRCPARRARVRGRFALPLTAPVGLPRLASNERISSCHHSRSRPARRAAEHRPRAADRAEARTGSATRGRPASARSRSARSCRARLLPQLADTAELVAFAKTLPDPAPEGSPRSLGQILVCQAQCRLTCAPGDPEPRIR